MIKLSVIIPTFNRGDSFLPRSIESVLSQTLKDFELIIVDDCSTDNTQEVVRQFNDPRIVFYRRTVNGGNAAARNDGVRLAKGAFVTFLDSDDVYYPQYLEKFTQTIEDNPSARFLFGGYDVYRGEEKKYSFTWHPSATDRGSFLRELKIGIGCGVVIHKSCFDVVGYFDEHLRVAVDTDFLIRLEKEYSFYVVDAVLVRIFEHEGERVRKNTAKLAEAYKMMIDKHHATIINSKSLVFKWYYKLMWLQYHAGQIREGNASYRMLKDNEVGTFKSFFIFLIFNLLPTSMALLIHKRSAA